LILPEDSGYDECRKVFNAMHDRRPAVIARCAGTADVVAAVNFARQHGLHTPGGRVTTTGIGGFTTGGGYGWTSSKYGLACDNLVSAEVVLADGRVVTSSEQKNEDLFWGIRGGGGNFGIVTNFEYQAASARTDRAGRPCAVAHRARRGRSARLARLRGGRSR
jgi:FAD/FMN-containing dehydrogenase